MPDKQDIFSQIDQLFGGTGEVINYDQLFKKPEVKQPSEQVTYEELFTQPAKPLQPEQDVFAPRQGMVDKLLGNVADVEKYQFQPTATKPVSTKTAPFQTELEEIAINAPELYKTYSQLRKQDNLSHEAALRVAKWQHEPEGVKPTSLYGKGVERYKRGIISTDIDQLMYEASLGGRDYEETKAIKDEYEKRIQKNPVEGKNFLEKALLSTVETAGPMIEGIKQGFAYGTAAAGGAIIAGQAGPQALTPEEIITAPAAFAVGQTTGQAMYWYKQGSGSMYAALRDAGIDHDIASPMSQIMGVPYAIIEFSQVGKIANPILKKVLKKEMPELIAATVPRVLAKIGIRLAKQATHEVGEEIAQEAVQVVSDEVGKELNNRLRGTKIPHKDIKEITDRLAITGKESVIPLTMLLLPGHAVNMVSSASGVQKFNKDIEKIGGGLGLDKKESKEVAKNVIIDMSKGEDIQQSLSRHLQEKVIEKKPIEPIPEEKPVVEEKAPETFEQFKQTELERIKDDEEAVKQLEEKPVEYIQDQLNTLDELITAEPDLVATYAPERERLTKILEDYNASILRKEEGGIPEEGVQPEISEEARRHAEQLATQEAPQQVPSRPSELREEEKELRKPTEGEVGVKKPLEKDFVGLLEKAESIEDVLKLASEFTRIDTDEYEISGKYRNAVTKALGMAKERVKVTEKPVIEEQKPIVEAEKPEIEPEKKLEKPTKKTLDKDYFELIKKVTSLDDFNKLRDEYLQKRASGEYEISKEYRIGISKEFNTQYDRLKTEEQSKKELVKPEEKELMPNIEYALAGKYDISGYTEEDITETGNKKPVKKFKADLKNFAKKLKTVLGYEPDYDKKGKDVSVDANERDGSIYLWKPNSDLGVAIYINVDRDIDDNLEIDDFMWRATRRDIKYTGMSNNFEEPNITIGQLVKKIEQEINRVESKKEVEQPPKELIKPEKKEPEPFDNWRNNLIKARDYANKLNVEWKAEDTLENIVAKIDDKLKPEKELKKPEEKPKQIYKVGDIIPEKEVQRLIKLNKPFAVETGTTTKDGKVVTLISFMGNRFVQEYQDSDNYIIEKYSEKTNDEKELKKPSAKEKKIVKPTEKTEQQKAIEALTKERGAKLPDVTTEEYGAKNKIVTKDRYEELAKRMREKLSQLNVGIDPEMVTIGTELAVYHIEAGVRKFTDFARTMVNQFGEKIIPFLKSFYMGAKNYPGVEFQKEMNSEAELEQLEKEGFLADLKTLNKINETPTTDKTLNVSEDEKDGLLANSGIPDSGTAEELEKENVETTATQTDRIQRSGQGERGSIDDTTQDIERTETTVSEETAINETTRRDSATKYGGRTNPTLSKRNYQTTDTSEVTGLKAKARNTIRAIQLWKQIEEEQRPATPEEQEELALFAGAGGLLNMFPDQNGNIKEGWEDIVQELRDLLTDEEYDSLKSTLPNAHYTSPLVITKVYDILKKLGFEGKGTIFEPGMGVGNFFSLLPEEWNEVQLSGVEMDIVSGSIAKLLYPHANISVKPFQNLIVQNESIDIAIGNVPFSQVIRPTDYYHNQENFSLHDYFFNKVNNMLKPGGIAALITSRYTLDKIDSKLREKLWETSDVIFVTRLPKDAFKGVANTEVVTDLIIFRKRLPSDLALSKIWTRSVEASFLDSEGILKKTNINEYLHKLPEFVAGNISMTGTMYAKDEMTVTLDENLGDKLDTIIDSVDFPDKVKFAVTPSQSPVDRELEQKPKGDVNIPNYANIKVGAYCVDADGNLYIKRYEDYPEPIKIREKGSKQGVTIADYERIKAFTTLRDAVQNVLNSQALDKDEAEKNAARDELNRVYDAYVERFGYFNDVKKSEIVRKKDNKVIITRRYKNLKPCIVDPDVYLVSALEEYDEDTHTSKKAQIFSADVIGIKPEPKPETASDALIASLDQFGALNLDYMAEVLNSDVKKVIDDLKEQIYLNPVTQQYETKDHYLSGNVRRKLNEAKDAAKQNKQFEENVKALEEVQPQDFTPTEIIPVLGMNWIPTSDIEAFVKSFDENAEANIRYIPREAKYYVSVNGMDLNIEESEYGTSKRGCSFGDLLELALNKKQPHVTTKDDQNNIILDVEATALAKDKMQKIVDKFSEWIWQDDERTTRLVRIFNDNFNTHVLPRYDGAFLTFKGMKAEGGWFKGLFDHQKNAVWRILQEGNTLLNHVVGSGKTITMITAGMEMKRLGQINKPMYVIPNHMLKQFSREFLELYPSAKIIVADEVNFQKNRRKMFVNRIATQDIDAVIITHSAFGKIPVTAATEEQYVREEIAAYEQLLVEAKADQDRNCVKDLQARLLKLRERLAKLSNRRNKDKGINFEETGVDFLFIDEAHEFKNLETRSKLASERIKNLPTQGAQKTWDLFIKSRYLSERNPTRYMCFATGTPVSNSMVELYSLMRYLQPQKLQELGIEHFDSWATNFCTVKTQIEIDPTGSGFRQDSRFSKFINLPQLSLAFGEVNDYVNRENLVNVSFPKIKGGKPKIIQIESDETQKDAVEWFKYRLENLGPPMPGADNALTIVTEGKLVALDPRTRFRDVPFNPNSKIMKVCDEVTRIYQETKANKYTQMIFCDLSVPSKIAFSAYNEIRNELVRRGIPEKDIAFMQDYKTPIAKERIFDDMRAGNKRILLGSTSRMGQGTNIQRNLYAVHQIEPPWKPATVEQRNGRIYRQGNLCPEIEIIYYVTKGTFDAYMWQTLEVKQGFIEQFFQGSRDLREMEDLSLDDALFDPAKAKALASANPDMFRKVEVDAEITRLSRLKKGYQDEEYNRKRQLENEKRYLEYSEEFIKDLDKDIAKRIDTTGDKFVMTVLGKEYTNRKEVAETIENYIKEFIKDKEKHKEGKILSLNKFGGFNANLRCEALPEKTRPYYVFSLEFTGVNSSSSPLKNITMDYFFFNEKGDPVVDIEHTKTIHSSILSLERYLRNFEQQKTDAFEHIKKEKELIEKLQQPGEIFNQEERLQQLKTESAELETKIFAATGEEQKKIPDFSKLIARYTGSRTSNITDYLSDLRAGRGELSPETTELLRRLEEEARQRETEEEGEEEEQEIIEEEEIQEQREVTKTLASKEWNRQAIEMLSKAIPGVKVYSDITQSKFDEALNQIGAKGQPLGFYSPKNNAIFINPKKANKDTIFHEFAHPLMNWIKETNPKLYNEGLDLLKGSKYQVTDEGLVQAIGKRGAQIQDEVNRNKFLAWLKKVWMKARIAFKRLFNINLSLNEFTSMISYTMRAEKAIMPTLKKQLRKPQFMYAGERAKGADFGNLEQAKTMESQGSDKTSIRATTGWFRGPDKLWRFEIDDREMKFKLMRPQFEPDYWNQDTERFEQKFSGRLGDIIEHDKLFGNYWDLFNLKVYLNVHPDYEAKGSFIWDNFNMLNSYIKLQAPNRDELRKTLAHEIQHWIQFYEGFAKGSLLETNIENLEKYKEMQRSLFSLKNGIIDLQNKLAYNPFNWSEKVKEQEKKELNWLRDRYNNIYNEYQKIANEAFERYERSAGEFEARDISSRIDMPRSLRFLIAPYSSEKRDFKDLIIDMKGANRALLMPDMEDPFITEMREKYHAGAYEDQSEFLQTLAKEKRHFTEVARVKKYWNEIIADKIKMPEKEPFDLPIETNWQWIQRKIQDKYNRSAQVVRKARESGETIRDELDFRQEMELYIGRASDQIEGFQKQITNGKNGFLERLTDAGIGWQDLSLFMYARHASERNETIRQRDPENDAGSGMTDEQAQEVLVEFEKLRMSDKLENFADQYYELVTKPTLDILYDSGLLSEKEYESYTGGWKYYVPLKGIERQETFRLRGKGFSVEYKGIIKAKGRHSLAKNNPFIQAIMDHEDAIIRAEKNKVGQSFLDFVLSHRSPIWKVEGRKKLPTYNKHGEIEYFRNVKQKLADNELAVWVEGKQKVITIYDTPLLNGLKNLGIEKGWKWLNKINHYLRLVNTMLNPEFIVSNFERDLQTALINLSAENTRKLRRKVIRDIPKAMSGIWKDIRDKEGNNWTEIFKEFREEGGKTGWYDYKSLDEKTTEFEKKIKNYKRTGNTARILNITKQFVFDINDTVENAVRVSAYKNAIESGMSKKQAANLAKNLTINFNKKGEIGSWLNSAYLFANAGVQGGARLLLALKSKRVRRVGYGLILWSLLWDTLNRLWGGDDYEKIDDYIKDTNHIFMIPGTGKHLRIRLPYGYNVFNVIGLAMSEVIHGGNVTKQFGRILSNVADAFNPLGRAGSVGQFISPTAFDLAVQLGENKNFFGAPIRKEQPQYAPKIPESQRYFKTVNPYTKEVTTWLNKITGGSERERGWLDINPENIDHVMDFIGGGTGKFIIRSINTPWTLISEGQLPRPEQIPFLRQIYGERSEWMDLKKINEYIAESGRTRFNKKETRDFMTSLNKLYEEKKITKENYNRKKSIFFNAQNRLKRSKRLIKK